jgi:hypothetical protein
MEPLMIILGTLLALALVTLIAFFIVKNKRISELEFEIKLYRQLTSEESKNNHSIVFVDNLDNYSTGLIKKLSYLISQSYQRFAPKWPLSYFGIFLDELAFVKNQEKKDLIKNILIDALSSSDTKIFADIVTKYLKDQDNFDDKAARAGLAFIISVVLKGGTCFSREFEENIKGLLASPEISDDNKILIQAGSIKVKRMLGA